MKYTLTDNYKRINILLAEDDTDDQLFFSDSLTQINYSTSLTIVDNGTDALGKLKYTEATPDIIFLDLNMPKMNGKECLKLIRENKRLKNIPCVILSTSSALTDVEETYKLGANLFLVKPTGGFTLEKMIQSVLQLDWQNYAPPARGLYFFTETTYQKLK
ncbi:MAG: response regulator [Sphingobacteriales bacterium]|nr:MAG: response regulator [Sphingobacteriales bacterium]